MVFLLFFWGILKCAAFCVLLDALGLLLWFSFEILLVVLLLAIAVVVIYLLPVDAA